MIIIKLGLLLAGAGAMTYLVALWMITNGHRGRRFLRPVKRLARRLPGLRSTLRRRPRVVGWLPPRTATMPHRASADYPDDIDISPERRAEVRAFLVARYGEEAVLRLGAFGKAPDA